MIGLAKHILEHREAIQYDLLKETGHEFGDIGRTLSWDALDSFLRNVGLDSALARELKPEMSAWATPLKTNSILADIADELAQINANLVALGSHKPAKKVKPYPRPWKLDPSDGKKIGSGGLPPAELRKWFERKRAEHARSSTGHNNSHPGDAGCTTENNG
jgi:hypothetical protein